ncbi:MAG: hypothetical protein Kow0065_16850 [Methylomicrobium sp.]
MKNYLAFSYLLVSQLLVSCTTLMENLPGVYTLDIQQGNIIDQEIINQLRPGMSKRQVLYVMGSPMLIDAFQEQRWDFIYSEQKSGEARMQKRVSLFFKEDNLVGVQGDFRPSSQAVERISHETTLDLPKRNLDKTVWEKITGIFGSDEISEHSIEFKRPADSAIDDDSLTSSSTPN